MTRGIRARINRSALKHNLQKARKAAPDSRMMAVVKANGYGHGLVEAARSLRQAHAFAVESTEDAVTLREAGIRQDLVLLSGFHEASELDLIARRRLSPVIHDPWQVEALRREKTTIVLGVWVKVDSGMHRLGFMPEDLNGVMKTLAEIRNVRVIGFLSHLANADDPSDPKTEEQCRLFREATEQFSLPLSLANSPGVLAWPDTHLDWIRPGMMLYGCSPLMGRDESDLDLRPAMTLESQIISIKTVPEGGAIGYGSTWRCETPTRVGVLACGYGDGYPRHAPSGTPVWVGGRPSQVLGRVSMDLMTIDLSSRDNAKVGDWVELWGANVTASTVAARIGTIPYEIVTRVAARVPRLYES